MGGLCSAVQMTGVAPDGIIFIEKSKLGRKVIKKHWPTAITYDGIEAVTPEIIKRWWDWFPSVRRVLIGGELPSSSAVRSVLAIVAEVRKNTGVDVFEIFETTASLGDKRLRELAAVLEVCPIFIDAADVGPCKRSRLYWIHGRFAPGPDATLAASSGWPVGIELKIEHVRSPPLASFLEPLTRAAVPERLPFLSFLRPFKKAAPLRRPAGLKQSSALAIRRWKQDSYRLPPFHYEDGNLVTDENGPRRLKVEEQARMLGFPSHYLDIIKKFVGLHQLEDEKGCLVGGAGSVICMARLIFGFTSLKTAVESKEGTGSLTWLWEQWVAWDARERERLAAGAETRSQRGPAPEPQVGFSGAKTPSREVFTVGQKLVAVYLRLAEQRGTDVRLDMGIPFCASAWPRCPVDARSWSWKVALSYKWRAPSRVDALEAQAVLDFVRHLVKLPGHHNQGKLFLLRSQVALGTLTKNWHSAQHLNAVMKRLAAVLNVANILPVFGWVPGEFLPTDGPPQWQCGEGNSS